MFLIIFFLIKSDCILKLYAFDCIYTENENVLNGSVGPDVTCWNSNTKWKKKKEKKKLGKKCN